MVDRDYILRRVKSRAMTPGEFNFDALQAPPILALLRPEDIYELRQIAESARLNAQLKKKYELIDQILRRRGFEKFISGTNRVAYRYIEDNSFLIKVAVDRTGQKDPGWEIKHQFFFKPFITKVFETTPCGTVGLFERVIPITNREEFLAVADDIYTIINEVFIGEYVLADFGTNFFMNWGIREGFGPVLLDFPYVYKLDGRKLYCNAADPQSPTGHCEGAIDYDAGYNFLECVKCGKRYKAIDLAEKGQSRAIIVRESERRLQMKFTLTGGDLAVNEKVTVNGNKIDVVTEETMPQVSNMQVNNQPRVKADVPKDEGIDVRQTPEQRAAHAMVAETKTNRLFVNPVPSSSPYGGLVEVTVVEKKEEEQPAQIIPPTHDDNAQVSPVQETVVVKDEVEEVEQIDLRTNVAEAEVENNNKTVYSQDALFGFAGEEEALKTMDKIVNMINEIRSLSGLLKDDEAKDLHDMVLELADDVDRDFGKFKKVSQQCTPIIIDSSYDDKKNIISLWTEGQDPKTDDPAITIDLPQLVAADDNADIEEAVEEAVDEVLEEVDESEEDESYYSDFIFMNAVIRNIKDLDPNFDNKKVLIGVDENDNYICSADGGIMCIDMIEGRDLSKLAVVSKEWMDNVTNQLKIEDTTSNIEEDVEDKLIEAVENSNNLRPRNQV